MMKRISTGKEKAENWPIKSRKQKVENGNLFVGPSGGYRPIKSRNRKLKAEILL
jgi:hypothetical protein